MVRTIFHTPWDALRWFRLALGLLAGMEAFRSMDPFPGAIAFVLLYQALANTGCCGQMACQIPASKSSTSPGEPFAEKQTAGTES